jgi:hypothetical protein
MRSTREIQTEFGPMLFSPVHARTLEPGDVVTSRRTTAMMGQPWVVSHVLPSAETPGSVDVHFMPGRGPMVPSTIGVNESVMRAVGARSGRML